MVGPWAASGAAAAQTKRNSPVTLPRCYQPPSDPPQKKTQNIWGGGVSPKLATALQRFPLPTSAGLSTCSQPGRGAGQKGFISAHHPNPAVCPPPHDECCPCSTPGMPGPSWQRGFAPPVPPARLQAGRWHGCWDDRRHTAPLPQHCQSAN